MTTTPDISVIIPMYNAAPYIGRALASILEQAPHGLRLEILVVDDASTDHSRALVRAFPHTNIRLIELEQNGGTARARNAGLQHARGAWIQFVDSDDRLSADLYRTFEQVQKPGFNCYVFSLMIEQHGGTVQRSITAVKDKRALGFFYGVWNFFIRRDLCLPFKNYLLEDLVFVFEVMAEKDLRIAALPGVYYYLNRQNEQSKTAVFNAPEYRRLYRHLYGQLDRYDRLTRMFFLETFVGILFAPTIPRALSAELAARTLLRLYRYLPAVVVNGIRGCVVNSRVQVSDLVLSN